MSANESQTRLLLVPLDDIVVFPNMNVTLTVDVGDEDRVLLVPKHEGEYAKVGTVAEVTDRIRLPGGGRAVALNGLHRAIAGAASTDSQGRLFVDVEERPDDEHVDGRIRELEREYRAVVEEILELRGDDGRIAAFVRSITEPGALADTSGYSPDLTFEQKVSLLETVDVRERLELALQLQRERLALMQVRRRIQEDVESGVEKQQREYILRRQLDSIRKELGEDEASVVEEYRAKIAEAEMPENVLEQAERELSRLERMGDQTPEATVIRNYLDWLLAIPWNARSEERLDPQYTREVLQGAAYGRADVSIYGGFHYDEANTESQDAYSLVNLRGGFRRNIYFVEGWVKNLFDIKYIPVAFAYDQLAPSGFAGESGAPRTFGVRVGVTF